MVTWGTDTKIKDKTMNELHFLFLVRFSSIEQILISFPEATVVLQNWIYRSIQPSLFKDVKLDPLFVVEG